MYLFVWIPNLIILILLADAFIFMKKPELANKISIPNKQIFFQLITNIFMAFSDLFWLMPMKKHFIAGIYLRLLTILLFFIGFIMLTQTLIQLADL